MSHATGRLVVVERYPDPKDDGNFRDLQAQLEGTENCITIARQRHIRAIKEFNDLVTTPPSSCVNGCFYHYEKMPQWRLEGSDTGEKLPQVDFGK